MSKPSRRPGRRNRLKGRKARALPVTTVGDGLKLVVATSPTPVDDGNFLRHDLEMVRSALLYADTVELLSPAAMMMGSVAALHESDTDGWLGLFDEFDDDTLTYLGVDRDPAEFRELLAGYRSLAALPRAQRRALLGKHGAEMQAARNDFQRQLASSDGIRSMLAQMLETAGAPELVEAVESGTLTLNWDFMPPEADTDSQIAQYSDHLKGLLASPSTHLLLDERMAGIARGLIDEGHVIPPDLTLVRAARSQVGTGLVSHLPAFPHSTISSVLEARAELAAPLASYRGGVSRLAGRVRSGAFDPGVGGEVADMWRDEVQPAIGNLRDDLSRTRLVREAAVSLGTDTKSIVTGGGLFFGVQALTSLEEFTAAGIAAAPVVGQAVASAYKESAGRRELARRHEFFYLLELDTRL